MLDFSHTANDIIDIQYYEGGCYSFLNDWKTWHKPRNANWIYMIGVGGAGSGASSTNGASGPGGGGGSSGSQTTVYIPAMFIPDTLYIYAGAGGAAVTGNATVGLSGSNTLVTIEPFTTVNPNATLLLATGGGGGAVNTSGGYSAPGATGGVATLANMCLAAKGVITALNGQPGGNGTSTSNSPENVVIPITGLMVSAGAGGGASSSSTTRGSAGFAFTDSPLGHEWINFGSGGPGGVVAASGTAGTAGPRNPLFIMNGGGGGGGPAVHNGTGLGLIPGSGGPGAPGCGGGGVGGCANTAGVVTEPSGYGGDGFVLIIAGM